MARNFLSMARRSQADKELEHDYLGKLELESKDKLDFGVKGMKWGIRKSDSSNSSSGSKGTPQGSHMGSDHPAVRYNRLLAQAKEKGANSLTEEELRFVNQRADAVARVERLTSEKPSWINEAVKGALSAAAKKTMKSVATGLAQQYIAKPIVKGK